MSDTPVIAQKAPFKVDVTAGKTYFWCACGRSASEIHRREGRDRILLRLQAYPQPAAMRRHAQGRLSRPFAAPREPL